MYFSEIATNPESNQQQQHQRQTPTADFVNHQSYYDSFASQAAVMSHHQNRPQMASSNDDHHHVYAVPARVRSVEPHLELCLFPAIAFSLINYTL